MCSVIQNYHLGVHSSSVTLRLSLRITGSLAAIIGRHLTMCPRPGQDRRVKRQPDHLFEKLPLGGFARTGLSLLGSLIKWVKSLFMCGMAGIMRKNVDTDFMGMGFCLNVYGVLVNGCNLQGLIIITAGLSHVNSISTETFIYPSTLPLQNKLLPPNQRAPTSPSNPWPTDDLSPLEYCD